MILAEVECGSGPVLAEPTSSTTTDRADGAAILSKLYRAHQSRVFNLILGMTGDRERAADLAQETWVRVLRGFSRFRGHAAFTTWIHRIAVNLVLEDRRNAAIRSRLDRIIEPEQDRVSPVTSDPFLSARLEAVMNRLPQGKRTVLVLHDAVGLTHEEVGRRLGCAPGTSRSQLHKARAMMRAELRGEQEWLKTTY